MKDIEIINKVFNESNPVNHLSTIKSQDKMFSHLSNRQIIAKALSKYTGRRYSVDDVELYADPNVDGTFAVRCKGQHYLIPHLYSYKSIEEVERHIEDVEFKSWPPKS